MHTHAQNNSSAPTAVESLEFRSLGIEWVVRRPGGERYTFNSLSRLRIALYNQTVTLDDELSFNRDLWRPIGEIPDLRAYFWMVWQRAQRGGLPGRSKTLVGADSHAYAPSVDEFDDEQPTRIVGAPPPVAPAMQVTIPCFTDEVPKPQPNAAVIGPADEFDDEAPTRIIGAPDPARPQVLAPLHDVGEDSIVPETMEVIRESVVDPVAAPAARPVAGRGLMGVLAMGGALMLGGAVAAGGLLLLRAFGII